MPRHTTVQAVLLKSTCTVLKELMHNWSRIHYRLKPKSTSTNDQLVAQSVCIDVRLVLCPRKNSGTVSLHFGYVPEFRGPSRQSAMSPKKIWKRGTAS